MKYKHYIYSLSEMYSFGMTLSQSLKGAMTCYLTGGLGAGKTSLVQGIMQGFAYTEAVTSPTYNLVHEYPTESLCIYHIDLYRLNEPQDAYELGLIDIVNDDSLLLIEWPEKGQGCIPEADCLIDIRRIGTESDARTVALSYKTSKFNEPTV